MIEEFALELALSTTTLPRTQVISLSEGKMFALVVAMAKIKLTSVLSLIVELIELIETELNYIIIKIIIV